MNKKITMRRYLRFTAVLPLTFVLLTGQDQPKVAKFVKPDKEPQSYVDRYNKGGTYKDWFDRNHKEKWGSIYKAVGLEEPAEQEMVEVAVATTEGDEPFYDTNGNGVWDEGDWWEDDDDDDEVDEDEPFVDANGDGIWNDAEEYDDANDNDEYDDGEEYWDTNDNGLLDDPEDFTDLNENGIWDPAEVIYDLNGNGEVDEEEEFEDTNGNGVWDGGPAMEGAVVDLAEGSSRGWNIGAAPSVGYFSGATFTNIPTGATMVINTPYGFILGPFDFNVSAAFGRYSGSYDSAVDGLLNEEHFIDEFNPTLKGVGGNLTFNVPFIPFDVFGEGHVGTVGAGSGVRGFGGVSLASLMKKRLNLPLNVLVGGEVFISSDMRGAGNPSGWLSIGLRVDYSF